jgi:hypothetical protein
MSITEIIFYKNESGRVKNIFFLENSRLTETIRSGFFIHIIFLKFIDHFSLKTLGGVLKRV